MSRKSISRTTQLAAALGHIECLRATIGLLLSAMYSGQRPAKDVINCAHEMYAERIPDFNLAVARLLDDKHMIGLIEFHHGTPLAFDGPNHFTNIRPMAKQAHRDRTAKIDVPAIAKAKRVRHKHEAHQRRMQQKQQLAPLKTEGQPYKHTWPKRKLRSRKMRTQSFGKVQRTITQ